MNNELKSIIDDALHKLENLNLSSNAQYEQKLTEVKSLQKQLLNSSVLGKTQLEKSIKEQLQVVEMELLSMDDTSQKNLELAYLVEYIKENYE